MKKIFILIVSLGLLYPDRPFAQNSIKLYPYQMPPSHHPDYQRHHVKSPDASFFNNKIQFIALRDLSGDYKQKLDQWVVKDKLGDILWVSYPLVFQDNLKEVVAEIKRRNLYLFDLWGYIPGSGPGGTTFTKRKIMKTAEITVFQRFFLYVLSAKICNLVQ